MHKLALQLGSAMYPSEIHRVNASTSQLAAIEKVSQSYDGGVFDPIFIHLSETTYLEAISLGWVSSYFKQVVEETAEQRLSEAYNSWYQVAKLHRSVLAKMEKLSRKAYKMQTAVDERPHILDSMERRTLARLLKDIASMEEQARSHLTVKTEAWAVVRNIVQMYISRYRTVPFADVSDDEIRRLLVLLGNTYSPEKHRVEFRMSLSDAKHDNGTHVYPWEIEAITYVDPLARFPDETLEHVDSKLRPEIATYLASPLRSESQDWIPGMLELTSEVTQLRQDIFEDGNQRLEYERQKYLFCATKPLGTVFPKNPVDWKQALAEQDERMRERKEIQDRQKEEQELADVEAELDKREQDNPKEQSENLSNVDLWELLRDIYDHEIPTLYGLLTLIGRVLQQKYDVDFASLWDATTKIYEMFWFELRGLDEHDPASLWNLSRAMQTQACVILFTLVSSPLTRAVAQAKVASTAAFCCGVKILEQAFSGFVDTYGLSILPSVAAKVLVGSAAIAFTTWGLYRLTQRPKQDVQHDVDSILSPSMALHSMLTMSFAVDGDGSTQRAFRSFSRIMAHSSAP